MYSPVLNTFPFCQKSSFPTCALIKHGKRLYEQWCCTLECWAVCRNEHSISPYSHRPGDKGLWSKPLPWPCLAQESSPHPCLFYLESYNIWSSCWNFLLRLMWLVEKSVPSLPVSSPQGCWEKVTQETRMQEESSGAERIIKTRGALILACHGPHPLAALHFQNIHLYQAELQKPEVPDCERGQGVPVSL